MQIAIIEDEAAHRAYIEEEVTAFLAAEDRSGNVLSFPDARSFLFARDDHFFDLLLLDIRLPGMDGMALARSLRQENDRVPIVFLTGESSFVFDGYKVEALDYLLKPIRKEELWRLLRRAKAQSEREVPKLLLETSEGLRRIALSDILYLEAQNKDLHLFLHTEGAVSEELVFRGALEDWMAKITSLAQEDFVFAQPHRSYFCQLAWVERVEPTLIAMTQGPELPLARSRRKDFLAAYLAFCRGRRDARS